MIISIIVMSIDIVMAISINIGPRESQQGVAHSTHPHQTRRYPLSSKHICWHIVTQTWTATEVGRDEGTPESLRQDGIGL